jgi:hypothetical protein
MIRYKHPDTGKEVISSNDHVPKDARKGKAPVITTADIERGPDGKFHRKGQADEKSR